MRCGMEATLVCFALALAASCEVEGVVGERPDCEPACGAGEICDPERVICVACPGDDDDDDCSPDAGACVAGRCVACTSDPDCPDELECAEDRCVEPDDDDDDDEDPSGSGGED